MNLLPLFKFRILPSTISKVTPPLLYAQDVTKMLILRCSTNYIVLCIYCGLCYFSPITFCFLLRYLEVGGSSHLNNICLHICCCCWCTIGFRCLNFNCKSCQNRSSVVHCITITTTIFFMLVLVLLIGVIITVFCRPQLLLSTSTFHSFLAIDATQPISPFVTNSTHTDQCNLR